MLPFFLKVVTLNGNDRGEVPIMKNSMTCQKLLLADLPPFGPSLSRLVSSWAPFGYCGESDLKI